VAGYAATTFLAFPHPVGPWVLDLGFVAAWLVPASLLLAIGAAAPAHAGLSHAVAPPGRAAMIGFACGLLAHSAVFHWIYIVTVTYGHAPILVGLMAPVLVASYIAVFPAAFAGGAAWLAGRGLASPLMLAALWTCTDHLRSFALSGFPWATLGYAQHANPLLMGLAPWTGVYGLSFATVLGASSALAWRRPGPWGSRPGALAGFVVLAVLLVLGGSRALAPSEPVGTSVRMAVLQGNIDQGVKWSPDWVVRTLEAYEELSRQAAKVGARILIWPETAVPGSPDSDPELKARLAGLASELGVSLVVGAVGIDALETGSFETARLFDSAFVFGPDGTLQDRYDKTHLVPFGEYLPLRPLLGRFIRAVATGSTARDVSAGVAPRHMQVIALPPTRRPTADPSGAGQQAEPTVTAGVPICYELLFPDLVRRFVGDGAGVLMAITNDAWYGHTGAPFQFLIMTAMRSAETGVWTARAANTGVSAFIDSRGRVREQTAIFERGFLAADVPVRPAGAEDTFYVRHGDRFAAACWIGLLGVAGGWAVKKSRRHS
jgi:apolipoprotein N-acyltransferase